MQYSGHPEFSEGAFFSPETPHSMVCDTVDACKTEPTLCRPRPDSTRLSLHRLNSTLPGCPLRASKRGERPGLIALPARRRNPSGKGETLLGGL